MTNIIQAIKENKIYGIIREDDTKKAIEIANAYIKGGIRVIEINSGIEAIREVSKNPDVYVAQGGVITSLQALEGIEAGAKLLVSPILQMNLVKLSSGHKIPLMLTATTPNEAYTAWKAILCSFRLENNTIGHLICDKCSISRHYAPAIKYRVISF